MEEKKQTKISLGIGICIFIIIVLIISLGITYYFGFVKKDNTESSNNIVTNTSIAKSNAENYNSDNIENKQEQNETENKTANNSIKTDRNKEYFVLYNGYEIEKKVGTYFLKDMDYTSENEQKYNINYYNYNNSVCTGEKQGKLEKTYGSDLKKYDGVSVVINLDRIATSAKYDAVPRKVVRETELPKALQDLADYTSVNIDTIDLDGDGKEEHIVCCRLSYEEGAIGDGTPEESSIIMLFDSNYKKIADLIKLEDGFGGNSLQMYKEGKIKYIEQ